MSQDQTVGLVWGVGALAIVVSALMARRVPGSQALRLVAIWIGIFTLALLAVSIRSHIRLPWDASTPVRTVPLGPGRDIVSAGAWHRSGGDRPPPGRPELT